MSSPDPESSEGQGAATFGEGYRAKSDFRIWIGFLAAAAAFSTLYTIVHLVR
jgi:hypothetical protein